MIELGGNIVLVGFRDESKACLIIIKKMVGQYARKISELNKDFKKLTVSMKKIHERETSQKYELKAHLVIDKDYNSHIVDRNIFFALDKVLTKVTREIKD